jgi:PAS domain S-box-containing protein
VNAIVQLATTGNSVDKAVLAAALDACPECIAVVETAKVVYANSGFAKLFGYQTSEVVGRPLSDFVPGNRTCTNASRAVQEPCGYSTCEFATAQRDGVRIRVQTVCARFHAGPSELRVISARDITQHERRRLVRDSNKRYRAIFDAAAIGIVQCAPDGKVVETNAAAERLLGYTRQELRGMHFRDFTHEEDVARDGELFQELIAGGRDSYQIEVRCVRKDRSSAWVRLTVSLVRGPDGNPESAIGMVEDITERKQAEQQLREAQKMDAIGRLVGGVAHDFNNLLTGIMLYCDLLIGGLDPNSRPHHHAAEIRMAGEHGAALVQQLLAVARKQVVERRVLSFNDVVLNMRNLLSRLIGENIELQTHLDDDLWPIKMDQAQAQQIVLNLVLNARDAMPDGGRVVLETRNSTQCCAEHNDGKPELRPCIQFTVSDCGCGMDGQTRARLFEPFFTTKGPGRGNGLGLATVRSIVDQEAGMIEVQSEPGKGTQVSICIPRAREAELESARADREVDASSITAGTILLVEDDAPIRQAAQRVLSANGYSVIEAADGREALARASDLKMPIDLLLTDVVMPGLSGRDVARSLQALRPSLRVIYMSGYDHEKPGNSDQDIVFVRKPFSGDALLQTVRQAFDRPRPQLSSGDQGDQL